MHARLPRRTPHRLTALAVAVLFLLLPNTPAAATGRWADRAPETSPADHADPFVELRRSWVALNIALVMASDPDPEPDPVEVAIATAKAQIGKPYRYGSPGPNSFDCSGLTSYSYRAAGVEIPRTSRAQYAALPRVPLDAMRPGDLVFSGYRSVSHVGIYLGDGMMVHAPRTGRNVEIAPVRSNLIGAARPHAISET